MKKIYLIRHCQAEGQSGNANLTREGVNQAVKLATFLDHENIQYIVSSPFLRAQKTIEPLARHIGLPINTDERLTERVLSNELMDNWVECLRETFNDLNLCYDGGESSRDAMTRGGAVINELVERPESSIAVVTHGCLMALISKYFDAEFGI